jgi:hypothetical protein
MIDLTDSRIGQLDRSNRPSTPRGLCSPASEKYVRQANFYEKAHFVKPTWRLRSVVNAAALPFERYASIRTVSEFTLR